MIHGVYIVITLAGDRIKLDAQCTDAANTLSLYNIDVPPIIDPNLHPATLRYDPSVSDAFETYASFHANRSHRRFAVNPKRAFVSRLKVEGKQ